VVWAYLALSIARFLAICLGFVALDAVVVFAPYLIDGSTLSWRYGRLWLGLLSATYLLPATAWLHHRFGAEALKLKPTRRQKVELIGVTVVAIVALVVSTMVIIPGAIR
jgi:hypothetical protein